MPPFFMIKIYRVIGLISIFFMAIAYLYPFHLAPWTTFYNDFFFSVFVFCALIFLSCSRSSRFVGWYSWLILFFLLCTHFLFLEREPVLFDFYFQLLLFLVVGYFSYLLGFWVRNSELFRPLLWAFCLVGCVSVLVACYQWMGASTGEGWQLGFLLPWGDSGRVVSNIGQANNFGMLMIVCLWVVYSLREGSASRLVSFIFFALVSAFVLGLYISGSRAAVLNLVLAIPVIYLLAYRRRLDIGFLPFLPLVIYLALVLVNQLYVTIFDQSGEMKLRAILEDPARVKLWRFGIEALSDNLWWGVGQGGVSRLYLEASPVYGSVGESIPAHVHNTVLDLLISHGVIFGSILVGFFVFRVVRAFVACRDKSDFWLFLIVFGLFVHAMVEYPLNYGFFFWLFCLMLGVITAADESYSEVASFRFRRSIGFLAIFALIFSAWVWSQYVKVESLYTKSRNTGITLDEVAAVRAQSGFQIFPGLVATLYWTVYRVSDDLSESQLADLESTARYKPFPDLLFKAAVGNAFLSRPKEAVWWLERLCAMFPSQTESVKEAWEQIGQSRADWPQLDWAAIAVRHR